MDVRRFIVAQTNRYSSAVRKILSIKGEEHDVNFGVHLEDERPEHSFIKGEKLWTQYNEVTSAAGTLSVIGVRNPPNSGVLGVVTNVWSIVTVDAEVTMGLASNFTVFVGAGSMWLRDGRWGAGNTAIFTTLRQIAQAAAAAGATQTIARIPQIANVLMDWMANVGRIPPIVLAPGDELWLNVTAVGVNTLKAYFAGYERTLESGELIPT